MNQQDLLAQVILSEKLATEHDIHLWQTKAMQSKQTLFIWIIQHKMISAPVLATTCARYFQRPCIEIENITKTEILDPKRLILFININQKQKYLLIADPNDLTVIEKASQRNNKIHTLAFTRYDMLCDLFNKTLSEILKKSLINEPKTIAALDIMQSILSDAIHRSVSDIHFEVYNDTSRVRMRIDGLLHHQFSLPKSLMNNIASCLKVRAKLNIAIKRIPQDGRVFIESQLGFMRDARISTYPTMHGEKIVLRLLDTNTQLKQIDELGFSSTNLAIVKKNIQKPQGLILITGPTGSGKTITLYTLLQLLNKTEKNIATIEDPIEIELPGINQSQINAKLDFQFSNALRALLRQDPDVLMIGEIRDKETAQIAIRAAQTGHLVLSTLHTNSVSDTLNRLSNMGITPLHISQNILLIIAQRLVRKLCNHCKIPHKLSEVLAKSLQISPNNQTVYQSQGCMQCTSGYKGRIGVFDVCYKVNNISSHYADGLWQSGITHLLNGLTSPDEIIRVIHSHD